MKILMAQARSRYFFCTEKCWTGSYKSSQIINVARRHNLEKLGMVFTLTNSKGKTRAAKTSDLMEAHGVVAERIESFEGVNNLKIIEFDDRPTQFIFTEVVKPKLKPRRWFR